MTPPARSIPPPGRTSGLKVPWTYFLLFGFILFAALFLVLSAVGIIDYRSVFLIAVSTVVAYAGIVLFAILGGVLVGMLLSHRILAVRGFTPFEEEMLKLAVDIKEMRKDIEELKKRN